MEKILKNFRQGIKDGKTAAAKAESGLSDLLALPDDVRCFIYEVTLHLQSSRSKTEEQMDLMFQKAYNLYVKYNVERREC